MVEGSGAGLEAGRDEVAGGATDRPAAPARLVVEGKGEGAGVLLAEVAGEPIAGAAFFRVKTSGRVVGLG